MLVRFRYHIITKTQSTEKTLLAEDCRLLGFSGAPANARWLDIDECEALASSTPDGNITPDRASHFLLRLMDDFEKLWPHLQKIARENGEVLLDAHRRVRQAVQAKATQYHIKPHLPPDVLGTYIYLPVQN